MSDKRSVHTDALATLGTIFEEGGRDAIHLAVEPVTSDEILFPGQDIGIVDGKASAKSKLVGIVDPFLKNKVMPGQKFWLIIYPRTITSLRHVWQHPDFDNNSNARAITKEDSEKWLIEWCATNDCPPYDIVKKAILGEQFEDAEVSGEYGHRPFENEGEYIIFYGRDAHATIPWEFWQHFENVHGKIGSRPSHFSCSC